MTPSWIIVHHTASPRDTTTVAAVNEFHRTKNWGTAANPAYAKASTLGSYVQYHYFITHDGTVTKCAEEHEIRWHSGSMNDKAIGICLAGWFDDGHDASGPTAKQTEALRTLLSTLVAKYAIPTDRVVPHRKFANKSCYGFKLADDWAAKLLATSPTPTPVPTPSQPFPVYKVIGSGTLYARIGNTLCRISTDWNTYVQNFGSSVQIVELTTAEFSKFTVAPTVAIRAF